jgi:hypothetical protein
MQIRVRVTKRGFLGGSLREEGAELTIDDKQFHESWMEKVDPNAKPAAKPGAKKVQDKEPI